MRLPHRHPGSAGAAFLFLGPTKEISHGRDPRHRFAGVTPERLHLLLRDTKAGPNLSKAGIKDGMRPDQLTPEQRIAFYQAHIDDVLRSSPVDHGVLDRIGNDDLAAAVGDTLFREGTPGIRMIQKSINDWRNTNGLALIGEDGAFGPQTLDALRHIGADSDRRIGFGDVLAHSRAADHVEPGETVRAYAYFQPVLP